MWWAASLALGLLGAACDADAVGGDGQAGDVADTAMIEVDVELDVEVRPDAEVVSDSKGEELPDTVDGDAHPCPQWQGPPPTSLWNDGAMAPLALRLPTPDGVPVWVSQGHDGAYSHVGDQRFAWDFAMPFGSSVHAAASGTVVWVEDTRVGAGPGVEWRELANFIVLDHGGGLFTSYVHLGAGSARVAVGDVVMAGEVLGLTGESGQLTGPHLHFQVENVWSESVPAVFARAGACDWVPVEGEVVVAGAVALGHEVSRSELPAGTFEEDGVVEVAGLPARLWSRAMPLVFSGRAPARSATEVYVLALPPEGGTALFARRFPVAANRRFQGVLDLSELAPGQYGLALVAGQGQAVRVLRSVRAAVVD